MDMESLGMDEALLLEQNRVNWKIRAALISGEGTWEVYAYCLLWSGHALSGSGEAYTTVECIFAFAVVLTGTMFMAVLIGEIANVFAQFDMAGKEYNQVGPRSRNTVPFWISNLSTMFMCSIL